MRTTIFQLIKLLDRAALLKAPIYEFGSYQVPGQESRSIRPLFSSREYVGCDMRPGPGVDRVLDLHNIDLPDETAQTVIVLDTLEHVRYLWTAMEEIHRILKPDGMVIYASVMYFPIHSYPSDYWRFTPEGFALLAEKFDYVFVQSAGLVDFPHTVVGVAVKGHLGEETQRGLKNVLEEWRRKHSQGWREILSLLLPPVLLVHLYKLYEDCIAWLFNKVLPRGPEHPRDPGD